jgi:hypothetical protein
MDEFKKELDELSKQYQDYKGGLQDGELDDGSNDNFPDYIVELKTKMLTPAKCGIYFTKKEIREIALKSNENISLKQRERMLSDLLRSIFNLDDMKRVFDIIKAHIDLKISYYKELSSAYPASKPYLVDNLIPKANSLQKSLDRILKESDGVVIL